MAKKKYVWFGMKVTPAEKRKIERLAAREGTTQKEAVLRCVEEGLSHEPFKARTGSILDRVEDLIGSVEGPRDLSTNPKYMEGFGR